MVGAVCPAVPGVAVGSRRRRALPGAASPGAGCRAGRYVRRGEGVPEGHGLTRTAPAEGARRLVVLVVLAVLSYTLILAAWVVTDPPGAAPDELDHYVTAVAAGQGALPG